MEFHIGRRTHQMSRRSRRICRTARTPARSHPNNREEHIRARRPECSRWRSVLDYSREKGTSIARLAGMALCRSRSENTRCVGTGLTDLGPCIVGSQTTEHLPSRKTDTATHQTPNMSVENIRYRSILTSGVRSFQKSTLQQRVKHILVDVPRASVWVDDAIGLKHPSAFVRFQHAPTTEQSLRFLRCELGLISHGVSEHQRGG